MEPRWRHREEGGEEPPPGEQPPPWKSFFTLQQAPRAEPPAQSDPVGKTPTIFIAPENPPRAPRCPRGAASPFGAAGRPSP